MAMEPAPKVWFGELRHWTCQFKKFFPTLADLSSDPRRSWHDRFCTYILNPRAKSCRISAILWLCRWCSAVGFSPVSDSSSALSLVNQGPFDWPCLQYFRVPRDLLARFASSPRGARSLYFTWHILEWI